MFYFIFFFKLEADPWFLKRALEGKPGMTRERYRPSWSWFWKAFTGEAKDILLFLTLMLLQASSLLASSKLAFYATWYEN